MRSTLRLFAPLLLLPALIAPALAVTAAPVSANCGGSATPIADIQGPGAPSPLAGQNVSIEAVVTADFGGTDGFGGFFVQQADPQRRNQPGVSEGLFVYARKARAKAGDLVHVTGKVEEKYGQTQLTLSGAIAVCANGQTVTPATLTLPVDSPNAFAAYEGMLVRLPQTLTVTDNYELGRYGSVLLSNGRLRTPTSVVPPSQAQSQIDANARNRLILDDGSNKQNPASVPYPVPQLSAANTLRTGYTVRDVQGVLEVRYGAWRVQPVPGAAAPTFDARANPRTNAPARDPHANLRVASFNVLNYFNGNGLGGGFDDPNNRGAKTYQEFQRQEAKIVSALKALDADVIGLMEIQNNGYGELSAVRQLAAKLGGAWRVVDPGTSRLGGDAIAVAMIYDSRKVEPVGRAATLAIDDKNRQPLAQSFRRIGGKQALTIVVNHLKSKNCPDATNDDLDQGDGQGCWNPTRTRAAAKLADWLAGTPTGVAGQGVLLIGDFNSYTYEDPIRLLESRGYRNLVSRWIGANAYSYVYNGEAGYLDHALASLPLASHVKAVHEWHINADEPVALQYTLAYKSAEQQQTYYAPDAYRSSDHDPVLIDIALPGGGR
ncbi:ExeM/NucH family extracellular endonuclease [Burkholderia multivorans]|uniref:ExeM/NucH family extracellular endonuclease n=1 Tax=Burkholderia multivorans TaxID=87883 RepID=UPI000277C754|nr:ExeM/NucH family extracellular endonuclease [Burkholderia multivorans]AJY15571.1 endonuclease/Exonuclease/phosphatase family protein [Burkholderia multivorans ATCC BAA-247]AVR18056.1 endonuclease [Burkholderia multivorans]EJO60943.1 endonuclease/exonuclease/phosphatase family protein [Burkholderia multivorans ATCC BAA-247]MBU9494349.1 ExeM/NucH family extracellular endonuclease [Burkholderia multivorans]MCO1439495.1 ExeM/NucH family extracellular endonuclease [Burkholderia multivorans]